MVVIQEVLEVMSSIVVVILMVRNEANKVLPTTFEIAAAPWVQDLARHSQLGCLGCKKSGHDTID